MGAVFVGIAVIAGVVGSIALDVFRAAVTAPPGADGAKRITIARDSVDQTLLADDAAKRETDAMRQKRVEEQRSAVRIVRDALVLGEIAYGASEADVEYDYTDGLSLDFVDGVVRLVKVSKHSALTSGKGVQIGTPVEELRRVYGEPSMVYGEDYIYFSEEDPTVGFAFEVEHGRVEEIKMGDLGL